MAPNPSKRPAKRASRTSSTRPNAETPKKLAAELEAAAGRFESISAAERDPIVSLNGAAEAAAKVVCRAMEAGVLDLGLSWGIPENEDSGPIVSAGERATVLTEQLDGGSFSTRKVEWLWQGRWDAICIVASRVFRELASANPLVIDWHGDGTGSGYRGDWTERARRYGQVCHLLAEVVLEAGTCSDNRRAWTKKEWKRAEWIYDKVIEFKGRPGPVVDLMNHDPKVVEMFRRNGWQRLKNRTQVHGIADRYAELEGVERPPEPPLGRPPKVQ